MSIILQVDLNKYFHELSEKHFRNMVYRFENTILHAGDKKYSIIAQLQMKAISQIEIVDSQPFTTELRKQFLHHYKIDKRNVISKLLPIIEQLQNEYTEKYENSTQKTYAKLEKIKPFFEWLQKFSPKKQEIILVIAFMIGVKIYNIAIFLRLAKPFTPKLRFVEPLVTEKDKKKIIKDLIRYLNTNRFIKYAQRKLELTKEEGEEIFSVFEKDIFTLDEKYYQVLGNNLDSINDSSNQLNLSKVDNLGEVKQNLYPRIQWLGSQKNLAELFVELKRKGFIEEIEPELIMAYFSKSDTIKQVLKPSTDTKTGENEYENIYTPKYKAKFDTIRINK